MASITLLPSTRKLVDYWKGCDETERHGKLVKKLKKPDNSVTLGTLLHYQVITHNGDVLRPDADGCVQGHPVTEATVKGMLRINKGAENMLGYLAFSQSQYATYLQETPFPGGGIKIEAAMPVDRVLRATAKELALEASLDSVSVGHKEIYRPLCGVFYAQCEMLKAKGMSEAKIFSPEGETLLHQFVYLEEGNLVPAMKALDVARKLTYDTLRL